MLTYFVITPILVAVFLYLFHLNKAARIVAIGMQSGLVVASFYLFRLVSSYGYIVVAVGGYEGFLGIYLHADRLSAVFVMLTAFMFLIAAIYSYGEKESQLFWFMFFIWQASLIGVFLTRDLFNVFVLTEVATIAVTVLIMYYRLKRSLYDGIIYFMINIVIMQFFLFGVGYVYIISGGLDFYLARYVFANTDRSTLLLPYALLMTFVTLKCALVPLYSWLPKAHGTPGAPAAVSAMLSGLHIKTGVYLFMRIHDIFGISPLDFSGFFMAVGIITAVVGIVLSVSQVDLKLVLAYSTVAQIGLIIIGLSTGTYYSYVGSLYHMLNHAVFKAALFLIVGIVSHIYHTRDITKIRGVMRQLPLVGIATVLSLLGVAGAPFFNASISKYFMMADVPLALNVTMTLINLGTIIICIKLSTMLFGHADPAQLEEPHHHPEEAHDDDDSHAYGMHVRTGTDGWEQAAVIVLGVMSLVGGVFGVWAISYLFGYDVVVDPAGYIEKSAIFAVSAVAGYFIFHRFLLKSSFLARVRIKDMGFRAMCTSIGLFFIIILTSVSIFGF